MAYFHILSHPGDTNATLRFKDLSEDQLRATFREQFPNPSRGDVSIIRTERPHDTEVDAYLGDFWQMVKENMPSDGSPQYPISPDAATAIRRAGKDITETLIRELEDESRGLHGLTPGDLY